MKKTFYLADDLNINKKNFKSLYDYLESKGILFSKDNNKEINKFVYGNYKTINKELIDNYIKELTKLNEIELYQLVYNNIKLFDLYKSELMSYLITLENYINLDYTKITNENLFKKIYKENYEDLILNISITQYWIEYFTKKTLKIANLSYVGIFGGNLIFNRVLFEVMKIRNGRVFVFESFFTGKHYYCEERYDAIPNNTNFKLANLYNNIKIEKTDRVIYDNKVKKIKEIMFNINNKNVKQPNESNIEELKTFKKNKECVLILGQVLNDFSLIGFDNKLISSINVYIKIIDQILKKTNKKIIFKAHPWEMQKINLKNDVTLNYLMNYYKDNERIYFTKDFKLIDLIKYTEYQVLLNSQSGIEVAYQGKKPFVFFEPFYGEKGFTNDLKIEDIENGIFLDKLKISNTILNCKEFDLLNEFLIKILDKWLINESDKSGINRLNEIFYEISTVKNITTKKELSKKEIIYKKIKKLIRDPKRFFQDMYIMRIFK